MAERIEIQFLLKNAFPKNQNREKNATNIHVLLHIINHHLSQLKDLQKIFCPFFFVRTD